MILDPLILTDIVLGEVRSLEGYETYCNSIDLNIIFFRWAYDRLMSLLLLSISFGDIVSIICRFIERLINR